MKDISLKEQLNHGDYLFPIHVYTHVNNSTTYYVNSHWHDEIEIIYIEEGSFEIIINMDTYKLKKGDFIFINKGDIHSIKSINDKKSIHHAIVLDYSILSSKEHDLCQIYYINPLINGTIKIPALINYNFTYYHKLLNEILNIIQSYNNKNLGYELNIKSSCFKILFLLAENNLLLKEDNSNPKAVSYKINLIKTVFKYIDNNYCEKIYIEDLARQINMNSQYFCRFFKSITGKTPIDYINHYRIDKATNLLLSSDDKIINICYNTGFDNFSYFIKTFKKIKGTTPSQYRNLSKK